MNNFKEQKYKFLLRKSKELREMLKDIIVSLFNEHEVLTKRIIKTEFSKRNIEYNKLEVDSIINDIQTEYEIKLTNILSKYYTLKKLSRSTIAEDLLNNGIKYREDDVKYVIKSLRKSL